MGDRSVPITSDSGCLSAKSLEGEEIRSVQKMVRGNWVGVGVILHGPDTSSRADIEHLAYGLGDRRKMQLVSQQHGENVVAKRMSEHYSNSRDGQAARLT